MKILGQGGFGVVFDIGHGRVLKAYPIETVLSSEEPSLKANQDDCKLITLNTLLAEKRAYEKLAHYNQHHQDLSAYFPTYFGVEPVSKYLDSQIIEERNLFEEGIVLSHVEHDCGFRWWSLEDYWWHQDVKQYIHEFISNEEREALLAQVKGILEILKTEHIAFSDGDIDILITRDEGKLTFKLIDFSVCLGFGIFTQYLRQHLAFNEEMRAFLRSGKLPHANYSYSTFPENFDFEPYLVP